MKQCTRCPAISVAVPTICVSPPSNSTSRRRAISQTGESTGSSRNAGDPGRICFIFKPQLTLQWGAYLHPHLLLDYPKTTDKKVVCSNHAGCKSSPRAGWQASTNSSKLMQKKSDPPLLRHSSARFPLVAFDWLLSEEKMLLSHVGKGLS
jgi:hypothetical protein